LVFLEQFGSKVFLWVFLVWWWDYCWCFLFGLVYLV